MIVETLIICATVYALASPICYAKAHEIRERAHKLELQNEEIEYVSLNQIDNTPTG